jgi:large subunit ribosomal protein L1
MSDETVLNPGEEVVTVEEPTKKRRESTSEKAKRAAAEREAAVEHVKTLDPLRNRGKKYREMVGSFDRSVKYSLTEAVALVQKTSYAKLNAAVDAHIKVKGDGVRGTVTLPHGNGKVVRVGVADEATLDAIAAGKFDFDILLATPAHMPKLAKFAKVLGPKGLMPSPKAGTVVEDIEKAKAEIGGGRIEYRADKTGVIHLAIGRVSFSQEQVVENLQTLLAALSGAKIVSMSLASTMGPGVKVDLSK